MPSVLRNGTISHDWAMDPIIGTTIKPLLDNQTELREMAHGHGLSNQFTLVVGVALLTIVVVAVVGNILLISAILSNKRLHCVLHAFIVNLAFSDLVTAIGCIPCDLEFMFRGYFSHGRVICGVVNTIFLISLPSCILSLSLLTAERLIAVLFPCRIKHIITKSTVTSSIAVVWLYTFAVGLFPVLYDNEAVLVENGHCFMVFPTEFSIFMVSANFLLPIVFIFAANTVLLVKAQKHHGREASVLSSLSRSSKSNSVSVNSIRNKDCARLPLSMRMNLKAAKRIALLVGVCVMCWLTYIIIVISNFICWCNPRELTWIANVINYSSTAVDPLLYGILNKSIRKETWRNIRRYFRLKSGSRIFQTGTTATSLNGGRKR